MTMAQLVAATEARLAAALAERTAKNNDLIAMRSAIEGGDTAITNDQITAAIAARDAADLTIAKVEAEMDTLRKDVADEARLAKLAETITPTGAKRSYDQVARIGQEPRTYSPETDQKARGKQFLTDVAAAFRGDWSAQGRLNQHMREEEVERGQGAIQQRAMTGTGAFSGFVVPQYLVDMNVGQAVARRPFADLCTPHDLPATGMTVYLSKVTTGTSVDLQTEGSAVSETNIDDTLITISVQTAAGSQTISRQAIERGLGVEEITVADLLKRYAAKIDSTLITQATNGLTNVATSVAYTDASPTGAELYPKLLAGASGAEGIFLNDATRFAAVMHPRRWRWLASQMTTSWPLIGSGRVPTQTSGVTNGVGYDEGARGYLPDGTPVYTDANIATNLGAGTNEDEVYIVAPEEAHLWEDPSAPMFIRAEQTSAKSLGIDLVIYGYFAYYLNRYTGGHHKIAGTGLVTPTF